MCVPNYCTYMFNENVFRLMSIEIYLERLLVVSGESELLQDTFLAQHPVDEPASIVYVLVLHEHSACYERGVSVR